MKQKNKGVCGQFKIKLNIIFTIWMVKLDKGIVMVQILSHLEIKISTMPPLLRAASSLRKVNFFVPLLFELLFELF